MMQVQEASVLEPRASSSVRLRTHAAVLRVAGGWGLGFLAILLLLLIRNEFTSWLWMLLVAFTLYGGFKLLTVLRLDGKCLRRLSGGRLAAYLLLWPGMRPQSFFREAATTATDERRLWLPGVGYVVLGMVLLWSGVTGLLPAGIGIWVGMFGFVFLLHFGLFDLLASLWRQLGVPVERLFDNPWCSRSLTEFWGSRWNRSFSALSRDLILRPLARLTGARWAGARTRHQCSRSRRLRRATALLRDPRFAGTGGRRFTGTTASTAASHTGSRRDARRRLRSATAAFSGSLPDRGCLATAPGPWSSWNELKLQRRSPCWRYLESP